MKRGRRWSGGSTTREGKTVWEEQEKGEGGEGRRESRGGGRREGIEAGGEEKVKEKEA